MLNRRIVICCLSITATITFIGWLPHSVDGNSYGEFGLPSPNGPKVGLLLFDASQDKEGGLYIQKMNYCPLTGRIDVNCVTYTWRSTGKTTRVPEMVTVIISELTSTSESRVFWKQRLRTKRSDEGAAIEFVLPPESNGLSAVEVTLSR